MKALKTNLRTGDIFTGIVMIVLTMTLYACEFSKPEPTQTPPELIEVVLVQESGEIIVNSAVMRAGPDLDYDQVGKLKYGDVIQIVGKTIQNDWLKIEVEGYTEDLWIASEFAKMSTTESTEEISPANIQMDTPTEDPTTAAMYVTLLPATPTYTPTSAPQATISLPETPTHTPTSCPAATQPNPPKPEPITDLYAYWNAVSYKDYGEAWELLSPRFKDVFHDNDINDYIDGYISMNLCRIELSNVKTLSRSNQEATLRGKLTYYKGPDCIPYVYTFDHHMVYSTQIGRWQIYSVKAP